MAMVGEVQGNRGLMHCWVLHVLQLGSSTWALSMRAVAQAYHRLYTFVRAEGLSQDRKR